MIAAMRNVVTLKSMTIIAIIRSFSMDDAPLTAYNKLNFVNRFHVTMMVFSLMSVAGGQW